MARPRLFAREVRLLGLPGTVQIPKSAPRRPAPPTPATAVAQDATRVLGLDLSIGTTGWALLVGGQPAAHGSFTLPDRRRNESLANWLGRRSEELAHHVRLLVSKHDPEMVAYEYPDTWRRSWSGGTKGREFMAVQGLARDEGMLITIWWIRGGLPPLVSVSTSDAKRIAAGRVDASKDQVRWALQTYRQWDLSGWTTDEVDAAAVALAAREGI